MPTTRNETVTAHDGGTFAATVVLPDEGTASGAGILLLQEIFGVNDFLLAKAQELAELGYVVSCPDVFWRIEPGIALPHDEASLQQAFGYVQRWGDEVPDSDKVADLGSALDHLRSLPEVTGPVAAMGYCLGGVLAYRTAANFAPDACVAYYGSGIGALLQAGEEPCCPTVLHYGDTDPFIPTEEVDAVRAGLGDRPDVDVHCQPGAGHAFENFLAPQFHDPVAAAASWPVTVEFLQRTLQR